MHKFENDKRIELTDDEIEAQEATWNESSKYLEDKRAALLLEKENNIKILLASGLTNDAIKCLRPDLKDLIEAKG